MASISICSAAQLSSCAPLFSPPTCKPSFTMIGDSLTLTCCFTHTTHSTCSRMDEWSSGPAAPTHLCMAACQIPEPAYICKLQTFTLYCAAKSNQCHYNTRSCHAQKEAERVTRLRYYCQLFGLKSVHILSKSIP